MKIAMFGAGYVGLVTGTCLAELGNDVTIVDVNKVRIENLNKGIIPIYEPGLDTLIIRNKKEGRLSFTLDAENAIKENVVIIIAVGTPDKGDGSTDLQYVLSVAKTIGKNINNYKVVVDKSTVPVGTADKVKKTILDNMEEKFEFDIVSNPEFLREGAAIQDFMNPDRIVVGTDSDKAAEIMREIHAGLIRTDKPLVVTDIKSSEMIKYAANAMLATRISFMNQLSHLCEKFGADIKEVAKGIGLDDRIGPRFLQAGIGYGGSCFPKDVASLAFELKNSGLESDLFDAVIDINERQKLHLPNKANEILNGFDGKTIGIWGLSFKPKTDDMREAPAIAIIKKLVTEGATVKVFYPEAMDECKKIFPDIIYCDNPYECAEDADAIFLITEWNEFRNLDFKKVKESMKGNHLFDGRNIYNSKSIEKYGLKYYGVGR